LEARLGDIEVENESLKEDNEQLKDKLQQSGEYRERFTDAEALLEEARTEKENLGQLK
jgi:hypothetical protein